MALASWRVQIIKRSSGRSAVAAAAYRAATTLHDERTGLTHSYVRKWDVVHAEILTPAHAPVWAHDRQQLWERAECAERRGDAQTAREVRIALPRELTTDQNIELARAFARTFVQQGMIADMTVHDKQDGNPHAHIMLTMRPLDGDDFSKKKNREWNRTERLIEWHKTYEQITNQYLERYGHDERIDIRSYAEQGKDQIPTIHLGQQAHRLEQKGITTERGDINREIERNNQQLREIAKEISRLEHEMEQEKERDREHVQHKGFSLTDHFKKVREEIQKTAEELGHRLTEKGRDILTGQQKNIENALSQLRSSGHESPSRPAPPDEPEQSGSSEPAIPTNHPRPQQEHPRALDAQRGSPHPYRPPPLRRHREERTLAGQKAVETVRERQPAPVKEEHHPPHPSSERHRELDFDGVRDRLSHQPQQATQINEPPIHKGRPLSSRQERISRFYEQQQPQQHKLSREEKIAELLKKREEQERRDKDDTKQHEK